jgi:hypothetical protein
MSSGSAYTNSMAIAPFVGPANKNNLLPSWLPTPQKTEIIPTMVGTAAFAISLSLSTWLQAKMRISTGTTRPIPSLVGLSSVAFASLACHYASIQMFQLVNSNDNFFVWGDSFDFHDSLSFVNTYPRMPHTFAPPSFHDHHSFQRPSFSFGDINISHALRVICVGLIAYKGLGGRFWSVAPSSYTQLGSFARITKSLPATNAYATVAEREMIGKLGRTLGCHTCGTRMIGQTGLKSGTKFIADHMPPKSAAKQMNNRWFRKLLGIHVKYRFYPQCVHCSSKQANILSDASKRMYYAKLKGPGIFKRIPNLSQSGGGRKAYMHGLKLRREHLAGGLLSTATVCNSTPSHVIHGNVNRFQNWQLRAEGVVQDFCDYISNFR